jgi:hypothetical protein
MSEETVIDTGDKSQVKKRKTKFQMQRENELEELKQILATTAGVKFFSRMLERCHMFATLSHLEPQQMAVHSGQRDLGLWLIQEIEAAETNGYLKLVSDRVKRNAGNK